MRSHMRGRGAEAEREQEPLRKKWVQHPIYRARFETARSKNHCLQEMADPPASAPLRACVNVALRCNSLHGILLALGDSYLPHK